ncbi:MAG TPA: hypothetical protein DEF78_16065 [Sphingobacterium sp.]|nr:hypothetical protein HMPREF3127_18760 [Sphingobacterium sp. HMSC13C05]HAF34040.1 hypothetical protein [Sphingobacterium sp.]HBW81373.1 hypothetical protein [Sphingobacterium sp.]
MATMSMAIVGKRDKRFTKAQIIITRMQIRPNQMDRHKVVIMMMNIPIRITTVIPMKISNTLIVSTVFITQLQG